MFVNLTPHEITVGEIKFPPSGTVARVEEHTVESGEIDGVVIVKKFYGQVMNLPAPEEGKFYIVSAMVRAAVPDRTDVLSPGDAVRDDGGRIIGVMNLVRN